ncbi:DUF6788 family protein [Candidatus Methanocrinis natronophilus]|uniref:DUF6788 domain-containing protein n=1 Tax=Candidatus Methanocrinis natronophilus TaxID=3033396 RepID=A0ABT5X6I4_9EURY|nr:DUF6788 family protein [Candidatus Methanocrinis natronophilus]MDF0590291.1 hypothetical protein [Candidatus Methanocrinis natronophilus]
MRADIVSELEALRTERSRIDARISELESLLLAEEVQAKDGVAEVRPSKNGGGSYVLQYTKCGKPTCRCAKGGKLHGPYWYLYIKKGGKTTCKYIGKNLPSEA